MKTLVIYYSRTGTTKKVGKKIAQMLKCDSEEIIDTKNRDGIFGYIKSGMEAGFKRGTVIKQIKKNPAKYGLVIIGTPVWAGTMASAVRTYIKENKNKFKKVAFFCTMGGSGSKRTFKAMEGLCKKKPAVLLVLTTKEVIKEEHIQKIKKFVKAIK